MTCGCKPVRARGKRFLELDSAYLTSSAPTAVRRPEVELSGTWDFKWPIGTEIRVAFQRIPPTTNPRSDPDDVRNKIIELAASWPIDVKASGVSLPVVKGRVTGIGLRFLDGWLEPPLGAGAVLGGEHNSPFLPTDRPVLEYDVLISLEDLPLARIDPFRYRGDPDRAVTEPSEPGRERVLLPLSELGSYARRVDYGAPTLFLGRFGKRLELPLLDHFVEQLGQHVVVHEFGHVLGLAHEHQNPRYGLERPYLPQGEVARLVGTGFALGTELTSTEVDDQIIRPWPGNTDFSDWRPVAKGETLYDLQSVMTYPYHAALLRPRAPVPAKAVSDQAIVLPWLNDYPPLTEPTSIDIENLRRMYERPPARRRSKLAAE